MVVDWDTKLFELTVEKDKISYRCSRTALSNPESIERKPKEGWQYLAINALVVETIETLIRQFITLSDLILSRPPDSKEANQLQKQLERVVKILGKHLYTVLFKGRGKDSEQGELETLLNGALNEGLDLIRIELEFIGDEREKNLAVWPWEYLYKPYDALHISGSDDFLIKRVQLVLNRVLNSAVKLPGWQASRKVRVLLVVVQPKDRGSVIYSPVLKYLQENLKDVVDLQTLIDTNELRGREPIATIEAFRKMVEKHDPDIIHFIGHGEREESESRIGFTTYGGEFAPVTEKEFARELAGRKNLKLVFLQACESALPDSYHSISGMAMRLALENIPAVVAMQYKIVNEVANDFACHFYEELSNGNPIDLAVREGRKALKETDDAQIYAFGLPVLYLRSYDRVILPPAKSAPARSTVSRDAAIASGQEKACPQCEKNLREGEQICGNCRRRLEQCAQCDEDKQKGMVFCSKCGRRLKCIFCSRDPDYDPVLYKPYGIFCGNCGESLLCTNCGQPFMNASNTILKPRPNTKYCKTCWEAMQQTTSEDAYAMSAQSTTDSRRP